MSIPVMNAALKRRLAAQTAKRVARDPRPIDARQARFWQHVLASEAAHAIRLLRKLDCTVTLPTR